MTDSLPGLTVREASERLGVHIQTLRGRLRDSEDEGKPIGMKLTGDFGPEWRICPLMVALMQGESSGEETQVTVNLPGELASALGRMEALVVRLTEAQKALPDPNASTGTIRDLAAQVGRLEAERDRLTQERDQLKREIAELREELAAEKGRRWWEKLMKPSG